MARVVLVDSNIPMYLIGAGHPLKATAQELLEQLINEGSRLVTDAEVLQEILYRYCAIDRTDAIQPAFDALLAVVDEVLPIDRQALEQAKQLVIGRQASSARDALHAAIMAQNKIEDILSFDRDFDQLPGITRIFRPM